jgi:SAM-dependent methyltransferase
MGIAKIAYSLLAELKRDYPDLGGTVLQLGRQGVAMNSFKILDVLNHFGIKSSIDLNLEDRDVNDIVLFKSLGFDPVESIDFDNYEKPTYTHDFNYPIPESFHGKYDAIYDGGTTEHVFNFPESLRNIYKMLKVGGIIMHASPSNDYVDHGFYAFSPTVFYDYYRANGFEIIKSCILEVKPIINKCVVYEYAPEKADCFIPYSGFGELLVWFVAQKIDSSTCGVIPQQHMYVQAWANSKDKDKVSAESGKLVSHSQKVGAVSRLKSSIKQSRILYSLLLPIVRLVRILRPKKPPVIAVYDYM